MKTAVLYWDPATYTLRTGSGTEIGTFVGLTDAAIFLADIRDSGGEDAVIRVDRPVEPMNDEQIGDLLR